MDISYSTIDFQGCHEWWEMPPENDKTTAFQENTAVKGSMAQLATPKFRGLRYGAHDKTNSHGSGEASHRILKPGGIKSYRCSYEHVRANFCCFFVSLSTTKNRWNISSPSSRKKASKNNDRNLIYNLPTKQMHCIHLSKPTYETSIHKFFSPGPGISMCSGNFIALTLPCWPETWAGGMWTHDHLALHSPGSNVVMLWCLEI